MKTFISFLGTNNYKECTYKFSENEYFQTNYTQVAVLKKHLQDIDKIVIFLTEDARRNNWGGAGKLKEQINNICSITPVEVDIPNGFNNNDLLEIFNKITSSITDKSDLIIDVTHSFRSLPITLSAVLNYLKSTKECSIHKIYYGAFEVLGNPRDVDNIPVEKRLAPVLDITYLDLIQEWTRAVDNLLKFGNANLLQELSKNAIKPILIETKGKDEVASKIRSIVDRLAELNKNIYSCRSKELLNFDFDTFNQNLEFIITRNVILPQIVLPLKKLKVKINGFSNQYKIENLIRIVKWCIEYNWIQQAYTLIQESIITYCLEQIELDYFDQENRDSLSSAISIINKNLPRDKWSGNITLIQDIVNIISSNEKLKELTRIVFELVDTRNDINHAGYRQNPRNPKVLEEKIKELYSKISELIKDS